MSRLPLLLLVSLLWLDSPNHNYSRAALTATLAHARTQLLFSRPFACSAASLRDLSHSFINMLSNPLSPGSTLSFPGPLKNPRKGFRRDATLGEEEEKKFRLKKQRSLLCVFFFSSQNGLSSTHAHTLEHRVNGSGKTAARSSPSLHPWHPPHLFPPTYSSSLPPSLSLSLLLLARSVRQNANIPSTSRLTIFRHFPQTLTPFVKKNVSCRSCELSLSTQKQHFRWFVVLEKDKSASESLINIRWCG